MSEIKGILFDIDGSVMPQGGPIDSRVAAVMRKIRELGIGLGPATGKPVEYCRGLAVGAGTAWDYIAAELGAQYLALVDETAPPKYERREVTDSTDNPIAQFAQIIKFDIFNQTCIIKGKTIQCRPELKEGLISIYPTNGDLDESKPWEAAFNELIDEHDLDLQIKRQKDACIDVLPKYVSKSISVQQTAEFLGCKTEQILTVVDGINDYELIPGTTAIAVSNAVPEIIDVVKKERGYVAKKPEGDGFIEGLLHYVKEDRLPKELGTYINKVFKN